MTLNGVEAERNAFVRALSDQSANVCVALPSQARYRDLSMGRLKKKNVCTVTIIILLPRREDFVPSGTDDL